MLKISHLFQKANFVFEKIFLDWEKLRRWFALIPNQEVGFFINRVTKT